MFFSSKRNQNLWNAHSSISNQTALKGEFSWLCVQRFGLELYRISSTYRWITSLEFWYCLRIRPVLLHRVRVLTRVLSATVIHLHVRHHNALQMDWWLSALVENYVFKILFKIYWSILYLYFQYIFGTLFRWVFSNTFAVFKNEWSNTSRVFRNNVFFNVSLNSWEGMLSSNLQLKQQADKPRCVITDRPTHQIWQFLAT